MDDIDDVGDDKCDGFVVWEILLPVVPVGVWYRGIDAEDG